MCLAPVFVLCVFGNSKNRFSQHTSFSVEPHDSENSKGA